MTIYEYMTHLILMQPGEVRKTDQGQFESGLTTDFLNSMGQQGWELVTLFPWQVQTAQVVIAENGRPAPGMVPGLWCVFKRCLGADTRPGAASVGYPRY